MSLLATRSLLSAPKQAHSRNVRAFTLVEIGLAALIIGLMAVLAIPQFKKSILVTRSETTINDLRVFSQAFQAYLHDKGDWPPETEAGGIPSGMEGYLRESNWTHASPIGGCYNWDKNQLHGGKHLRAAIAISSKGENRVTTDMAQLLDIDLRYDDGNLSTGSFRLGAANEPVFVIEP